MLISEAALRQVAKAVVARGGSAEAEAATVADHLVRANLAGHDSHGVGMLPTYVDHLGKGMLKPNVAVRLEQELGSILRFDGGSGYGQRVAAEAMDQAIARCRELGLVAATLRDAHHIGRVGSYGEQAIAAGLMSVHFVNVTDHLPIVAPFRGREPRLVTNPVCVAVPGTAKTEPTLLDMATSQIAFGKVRVAYNEGRSVPDGALIDHAGQPTRDPAVMHEEPLGALMPMGEHKGYCLALACELLAGLLSGGGTIQPGNGRGGSIINHMLTFVINPARFGSADAQAAEYDAVISYMKSAQPADPDKPVLTAGDPERATAARRKREGIPLDEATWEEILVAGASLGLDRGELTRLAAAE